MSKSEVKVVELRPAAPTSRLLQEHSAARLKLAQLISDRLSTEDKLRGLVDSATALREAAEIEDSARAALNALETEEAKAMLAWSQHPSDPKPILDGDRRAEMKNALDIASVQAAAARNAVSSLSEEQTRLAEQLMALDPKIREAIVDVLIESTAPLIETVKQTQLSLARQQGLLNQAVQTAIDISRPGPQSEPVGSTGAAIGALIASFKAAGPAAMQTTAADVAAWKTLAERLRSDPLAELET